MLRDLIVVSGAQGIFPQSSSAGEFSRMTTMTYSATVQFLYGLQQHGIKLGLETVRALLTRMGSRTVAIRCFTSAGRTGKAPPRR